MKLQSMTLPTAEEMARRMGLRDLRIGRHHLRGDCGDAKGSCTVCSFWFAEVVPSFHPLIALAVATAVGEQGKDCRAPDFVKAVLATAECSHVVTLEADPMPQALKGLDLFGCDQPPPRHNGIAYAIAFQTIHLHGTLQFGNPTHRGLRAWKKRCSRWPRGPRPMGATRSCWKR